MGNQVIQVTLSDNDDTNLHHPETSNSSNAVLDKSRQRYALRKRRAQINDAGVRNASFCVKSFEHFLVLQQRPFHLI